MGFPSEDVEGICRNPRKEGPNLPEPVGVAQVLCKCCARAVRVVVRAAAAVPVRVEAVGVGL
eukprot:2158434-Prymnesium_polylepis.1